MSDFDESGQKWAGMNGAAAWALIDRHSDGWNDTERMMNAWRDANRADQVQKAEPVAWLHTVRVCGDPDGETDQALSFVPDAFPFGDTGMFESLGSAPLYMRLPFVNVETAEWTRVILNQSKCISSLRARLEVRDDGGPDGITCRDETIRLQDEMIVRLRAENERLKGALQEIANTPTTPANHDLVAVIMLAQLALRDENGG